MKLCYLLLLAVLILEVSGKSKGAKGKAGKKRPNHVKVVQSLLAKVLAVVGIVVDAKEKAVTFLTILKSNFSKN